MWPFDQEELSYKAMVEIEKKRHQNRSYKQHFMYGGYGVDREVEETLNNADIEKAEDLIAVLKDSPKYQQMLCNAVKKKLEKKRQEVFALESKIRGNC